MVSPKSTKKNTIPFSPLPSSLYLQQSPLLLLTHPIAQTIRPPTTLALINPPSIPPSFPRHIFINFHCPKTICPPFSNPGTTAQMDPDTNPNPNYNPHSKANLLALILGGLGVVVVIALFMAWLWWCLNRSGGEKKKNRCCGGSVV